MNKLILIRHGEAEGNIDKSRCKNDKTNTLTRRGKLQAELAGVTLSETGIDITHLLSSSKTRALETITRVGSECKELPFDIKVLDSLNECKKSESFSGEATKLAVDKINTYLESGNVLVVSHYFALKSLAINLGIELTHQGLANGVINIVDSNGNVTMFNGNTERPGSYGSC